MIPKPRGLGPEYGAQFQDAAVVAAYQHRPPYPEETFNMLCGLISGDPASARVLDLGCGTGDIARPLARRVGTVDALDISAPMIERARALPDGERENIRWIAAPAETGPLEPPYSLVTAAESLHWMDWNIVLPRIANALAPGAVLAIVGRNEVGNPWWPELLVIIQRYSTNRDFEPYGPMPVELATRGLFQPAGKRTTSPIAVEQSVADYIESIHSRNGFSRDRMTHDAAMAFDRECRALLSSYAEGGTLRFAVTATVAWGIPLALETSA